MSIFSVFVDSILCNCGSFGMCAYQDYVVGHGTVECTNLDAGTRSCDTFPVSIFSALCMTKDLVLARPEGEVCHFWEGC